MGSKTNRTSLLSTFCPIIGALQRVLLGKFEKIIKNGTKKIKKSSLAWLEKTFQMKWIIVKKFIFGLFHFLWVFCFVFLAWTFQNFLKFAAQAHPKNPGFVVCTTRYPPLVAISLSPPFLIILTFGGLGAVIRWLRGGKSIEDEGLTGESRPPPSMETGLEAAEEEEEEEGAWITVKATRWLAAIKKRHLWYWRIIYFTYFWHDYYTNLGRFNF